MRSFKKGDRVLFTPEALPSIKWYNGEYIKSTEDAHGNISHQIKSRDGKFYYPDEQVKYHPKFRMWNRGDLVEVSLDNKSWFPAIFKNHSYESHRSEFSDYVDDIPYRVMGKEIEKYKHSHKYKYGLWFPYCRDRKN